MNELFIIAQKNQAFFQCTVRETKTIVYLFRVPFEHFFNVFVLQNAHPLTELMILCKQTKQSYNVFSLQLFSVIMFREDTQS